MTLILRTFNKNDCLLKTWVEWCSFDCVDILTLTGKLSNGGRNQGSTKLLLCGWKGSLSPSMEMSVCEGLVSDSPGRYLSRDTCVHDVPFVRIILDDVPIRCRNDVQYCTVPPYHFSNNVNNLRSVTYTITSIISGNVCLNVHVLKMIYAVSVCN